MPPQNRTNDVELAGNARRLTSATSTATLPNRRVINADRVAAGGTPTEAPRPTGRRPRRTVRPAEATQTPRRRGGVRARIARALRNVQGRARQRRLNRRR